MGHYQAVTGEIRKDSTAADEKHGARWISWRKALRRLDWIIDYYFVYLLYNDHKVDEYDDYMRNKWGARE
jgi:hypothetical protein